MSSGRASRRAVGPERQHRPRRRRPTGAPGVPRIGTAGSPARLSVGGPLLAVSLSSQGGRGAPPSALQPPNRSAIVRRQVGEVLATQQVPTSCPSADHPAIVRPWVVRDSAVAIARRRPRDHEVSGRTRSAALVGASVTALTLAAAPSLPRPGPQASVQGRGRRGRQAGAAERLRQPAGRPAGSRDGAAPASPGRSSPKPCPRRSKGPTPTSIRARTSSTSSRSSSPRARSATRGP